MKPCIAVVAALSITLSGSALAAKKVPITAPVVQQAVNSSAPEALAVINESRALEAKIESGLNYRDYGVEVANLTAKLSALDELLESKGDTQLRAKLSAYRERYQTAKTFWTVCISTRDCKNSFISLNENTPASNFAKELLELYPEMKRPTADGGAYEAGSGYVGPMAHYPRLLSAIWADGADKGKALRAALR